MTKRKIRPIHPGEILSEEFMIPMKLSQNRLARDLGVPPRRINEIVQRRRSLTADTALRLARYFAMSPQFWLGLQMEYNLAIEEDQISGRIAKQVRLYDHSAAA